MKAIIPAAGLATRFLPAAKSIPKELLPVAGKPAIQWVVEEAVASGVDSIVMITGRGKGAIEDHFDLSVELDSVLRSRDQAERANELAAIGQGVPIASVRQRAPLGLGHAVLQAAPFVADQYFGVMLPDDLYFARVPVMAQLAKASVQFQASTIALMEVPPEDTSRYGIAEVRSHSPGVYEIVGLVEKPKPEDARTNLAVVGRYFLHRDIFSYLLNTEPGKGGEIQLTDALCSLCETRGVMGVVCEGTRHDVGTQEGWLKANVEIIDR